MNPIDLRHEVFGNSLLVWGACVAVFALTWSVLLLVRRVSRSRLLGLTQQREVIAFEVAERVTRATMGWFLLVVAVFAGSRPLALPPEIDGLITKLIMVALLLQGGLWLMAAVLEFLDIKRKRELRENPGAVAAMDVLSFVARIAIWSVVLLVILDNLGVNVTTLVASLGVGGIAVALAAQNVLGDLFASLSIVLDKPFVVGDFLIIDDFLGTVEKVGIKTTRVRSLSGEQLIFANNDLLSSRIRNYGRMFERRVVFALGVTYQTASAQLRRIPDMIREAVEARMEVRFDRAHFQKYGDFALIFEAVYYVLSPDYNKYMDIQQAINLELFERFEKEGIEFAYPTQTVFVSRV